jgi:TolB-like protein
MTERGARIFYEFGGFRLDPQQRLLTVKDGRPIPLPPKALETLLYFVERRGELLEKATLMKAIWPNIVVEENSLNQNISVIRRALGESPGEHRFIVTEPGRGYRFVADVGVVAEPPSTFLQSPPAGSPVAPAPQAAPAQRKSIAVLAFANLTGDPAKEYFGDGMAEELIHTLARIPGLKVPSRTSSFAYKGRNTDVRQIARDLEVGVVLEGSVRSAGERIRVAAQLIDGQNGFHVWSEHYDREFGDLFKLQDELARAIVDALRLTMDEPVVGHAMHEPPTRDLEAYQLYLQAVGMQFSAPTQSVPRALRMLERAVDRDPLFARAHSAIAVLRALAIVLDTPLPGTLAESEREALRSLALDAGVGSTHAALGTIYAAQGKWISAEERFHDALARDASDPSSRLTYGMNLLGTVGFLRGYAKFSLDVYQLAPAWFGSVLGLAVVHMLLDEPETARRFAELGVDLGIPAAGGPLSDVLAQLALREGRYEEAAEITVGGLPAGFAVDGGADIIRQLFSVLRDRAPAGAPIEALNALRARAAPAEMTQIMKRRFMVWYTLLGALDQAFEVFTESLDCFARSGTIGTAWAFLWMRELLPFRQDLRFQSLCRRMGLFDYWNKYGPPDHCELRNGKLICR